MDQKNFLRFIFAATLIFSTVLMPKPVYAIGWTDRITFDEACFPSETQALMAGDGTTILLCDAYTGSGAPGVQPIAGADGTIDLLVTAEVVTSPNNTWPQADADYATTSSGSFRSDWTVTTSSNPATCSAPNMWGYVKFDFVFTGALSAIQAQHFATSHISANGSSEAYEYTLVTLNGSGNGMIESNIDGYTNAEYQNGVTASEHILGITGPNDPVGGGQMATGFWAVDDFNTKVDPNADEAPSTNPDAGNGGPDDNQTISGSAANDSGDGSFGLADGTIVSRVTYYFALQDVAFDTDGDGCTETNTLPSAGVTHFDIGYEETTAVELANFDATSSTRGTAINWTTAAEIDNAGFNVYGGPSAAGPWTRLNPSLIPAAGSAVGSTDYGFVDSSGSTFYMLEDVDRRGAITLHGPIGVGNEAASASTNAFSIFLPLLEQ